MRSNLAKYLVFCGVLAAIYVFYLSMKSMPGDRGAFLLVISILLIAMSGQLFLLNKYNPNARLLGNSYVTEGQLPFYDFCLRQAVLALIHNQAAFFNGQASALTTKEILEVNEIFEDGRSKFGVSKDLLLYSLARFLATDIIARPTGNEVVTLLLGTKDNKIASLYAEKTLTFHNILNQKSL